MQKEGKRTGSLLMLIFSMVIFGTIGILRRNIPLSSGLIAFVRAAVGSAFLAAFIRLRGRRFFQGIQAADAIWPAAELLLLA